MQTLSRSCERHERWMLAAGVAVAVLVRYAVSLHPHSGEGKPPMHGDFEAQRHWLEITTGLPPSQWYHFDLEYWGLDYPPLTAFHSYALGTVAHRVVPDCVSLNASRGHESPACRFFMRTSVTLSDLLVYLPGAAVAVRAFAPAGESAAVRVAATLAMWLHPALLLIDHGHFQYNGVCLGLCLWAAGLVIEGRTLVASVLFTSALLFKQISLYYAPAFFAAILAVCLSGGGGVAAKVSNVAVTGMVVLCTAALLFSPWLAATSPVAEVAQVIHRMFPFARGLYEDKVANFWCSASVVLKMHRIMSREAIVRTCAAVTLAALTPACAAAAWRPRCAASFACALLASALAFFLFAFQVHEKSILFASVLAPLLPLAAGSSLRPSWATAATVQFVIVSIFSMYPLVVKDELRVAYAGIMIATAGVCEWVPAGGAARWVIRVEWLCMAALHLVHARVAPPARAPDAWTLLITGFSCAHFCVALVYVTAVQLVGLRGGRRGHLKRE
eukprot:TRINITY_DN28693_c0_g1_i1.p1 TRINITY_DN28693_c0_g1~~TRINITY_DN28693_c0_g1_i1.p1  ORF type:complete len:501 (+),score=122.70 TRINITY_DN28693_c0_g1_i1:67-1569(+)